MAKAKMAYTQRHVFADAEILFNSAYVARAVTLDKSAFDQGICYAGTPVDFDGKVANNDQVIGILLKDVYESRPQGTAVYQGAIRLSEAEGSYGESYSVDMMDALKNVVFVKDDNYRASAT